MDPRFVVTTERVPTEQNSEAERTLNESTDEYCKRTIARNSDCRDPLHYHYLSAPCPTCGGGGGVQP